jgi:hypothetical protein
MDIIHGFEIEATPEKLFEALASGKNIILALCRR